MASLAVAAIIVAAVAAGASAYMASEAQADAARQNKRMAKWQQEVEEQQAEAARKQVRLRSQRLLKMQASKAAGAGVVAHEGSLLVSDMEAASLAQYEEDLAAFSHELAADTRGFESRLFRRQERTAKNNQWLNVGLATGSSLASSYASYGGRSGGTTVATTGTQRGTPDSGYSNLG